MASSPSFEPFQSLQASRRAALTALHQIDESALRQPSRLTLPEIEKVQEEIARILLAFVLNLERL